MVLEFLYQFVGGACHKALQLLHELLSVACSCTHDKFADYALRLLFLNLRIEWQEEVDEASLHLFVGVVEGV